MTIRQSRRRLQQAHRAGGCTVELPLIAPNLPLVVFNRLLLDCSSRHRFIDHVESNGAQATFRVVVKDTWRNGPGCPAIRSTAAVISSAFTASDVDCHGRHSQLTSVGANDGIAIGQFYFQNRGQK